MVDATITTGAVGHAQAQPDEVALQFRAHAVEDDVNGARRAAAEQAARLRSVLADEGVSQKDVRTTGFGVSRRPPGHPEAASSDAASRPYEGRERISVTLHDLDALGDVLAAAVEVAEVEVQGVQFGFRTETERGLQRDALADAVATARTKAEAGAEAEGLAVGDVRSMTTESGSRPVQSAALGMDTEASNGPESGPINVAVNVEVEYELENGT